MIISWQGDIGSLLPPNDLTVGSAVSTWFLSTKVVAGRHLSAGLGVPIHTAGSGVPPKAALP